MFKYKIWVYSVDSYFNPIVKWCQCFLEVMNITVLSRLMLNQPKSLGVPLHSRTQCFNTTTSEVNIFWLYFIIIFTEKRWRQWFLQFQLERITPFCICLHYIEDSNHAVAEFIDLREILRDGADVLPRVVWWRGMPRTARCLGRTYNPWFAQTQTWFRRQWEKSGFVILWTA